MIDNGQLIKLYDEAVHYGMRLGRNMILDARSLAYMIEDAATRIPIKPVAHNPVIGVLDQGQLGSCTGNAGTYALSAVHETTHVDTAALDETYAVQLYSDATKDDDIRGVYPPDDTGSSGLGVCRVLHHRSVVSGYRWARSVDGVGRLLQTGGAMFGTPWFEAWFDPDPDGFVDAADNPGPLAGGHEIYVAELEKWDERRPENSVVRFVNSWGPSWGDNGSGRMRLSTYQRYRSEIDVKQLSR